MLPPSQGRDGVPWSPYPDQAPNLVSPDSRPVPFTLSFSAFPRVRFPISNQVVFTLTGSQDQSRPRSEFDAAPRTQAKACLLPCRCGVTEPPGRLPTVPGPRHSQASRVLAIRWPIARLATSA